MEFVETRGAYTLTTDQSRFDLKAVHAWLTESYWSKGIPYEVVERATRNSLSFGLLHNDAQVGFARMITDRATFAYLADVFVLEAHQGGGLGKWMMERILGHPDLQNLRRMHLVTRDAHGLYAEFGFRELASPERHMEKVDLEIYASQKS